MADDHSAHTDHDVSKYVYVFLALCVLTSASAFTYTDIWRDHMRPEVGWAFMMAVSCAKALLVVLFFMHVKYEANWKYVLTVPQCFMAAFLMLALVPDVGMRDHIWWWTSGSSIIAEERRLYMAVPASGETSTEHGSQAGDHPEEAEDPSEGDESVVSPDPSSDQDDHE